MRIAWLLPALALAACGPDGSSSSPDMAAAPDMAMRALPVTVTITPGESPTTPDGLTLSSGGDADTTVVMVGSPAQVAVRSGNGNVVGSANTVKDLYIQFDFPDALLFEAAPTSGLVVDIEYFDDGVDSFLVEYDGAGAAFTRTYTLYKTNSQRFLRARFVVADAFFGNRVNGGDLRIDDAGDGAETIRSVSFTVEPPAKRIAVDDCGADPFDDAPDSDAIQTCIDMAQSGDVVVFTSAGAKSGYQGYRIDKTLALVNGPPARSRLTFTSSDPSDRALLQATSSLKGPVARLFARSHLPPPMQGQVDDIVVSHLHLDADGKERMCFGPNGNFDGVDDNWGSLLAGECGAGDPWCHPAGLLMNGAFDFADATQAYADHPDAWSTGLVADDLVISDVVCGTALGLNGAASVIARTAVQGAGDHVHGTGCTKLRPSEPVGGWSDGFTVLGPAHQLVGNTVVDASDVGIVHFGGHGVAIAGNTVRASAGNHGTFAAIAEHAWTYGDVGFTSVVDNTIVNEGDTTCGGIHAGINLGPHMWGGACANANASGVGAGGVTAGSCPDEPTAPAGAACPASGLCQQWASLPAGTTFTLAKNRVTGAHVNYLVEGFDGAELRLADDGSNTSMTPRVTDWSVATSGCGGVMWTPTDKIAHHPALTGWTDKRIHCER